VHFDSHFFAFSSCPWSGLHYGHTSVLPCVAMELRCVLGSHTTGRQEGYLYSLPLVPDRLRAMP